MSVISEHQLESGLQLTAEMTGRFLEMTVLAVDGQGLIDMETVLVEEVQNCPIYSTIYSPASTFIQENLTHVCLVVIIAMIMISFFIIKRVMSVKQEQVRRQALEKVPDINNVFFICQESLNDDVKYHNLL